MNTSNTVVLLMAYGTPTTSADIEAYYLDIRRGRPPEPHQLKELQGRYAAVGGTTPLLKITEQQAAALERRIGVGVYIGMKHWQPYIRETVERISRSGAKHIVALALAPHFSTMSVADYARRLHQAVNEVDPKLQVTFIERWGSNSDFVDSICERLEAARTKFSAPSWDGIEVVFTAHSLPERILAAGDPYHEELLQTAQLVADRLAVPHWQLAFQSAGRTSDKWLGPDLLAQLRGLAKSGARRVIVAPIGFVTDNLEILYDLDIEAASLAGQLGMEFQRMPMANATAGFIDALASTVKPYIAVSATSGK
jgi:protoporphyrin/coproporphyrin ferrochelatase